MTKPHCNNKHSPSIRGCCHPGCVVCCQGWTQAKQSWQDSKTIKTCSSSRNVQSCLHKERNFLQSNTLQWHKFTSSCAFPSISGYTVTQTNLRLTNQQCDRQGWGRGALVNQTKWEMIARFLEHANPTSFMNSDGHRARRQNLRTYPKSDMNSLTVPGFWRHLEFVTHVDTLRWQ